LSLRFGFGMQVSLIGENMNKIQKTVVSIVFPLIILSIASGLAAEVGGRIFRFRETWWVWTLAFLIIGAFECFIHRDRAMGKILIKIRLTTIQLAILWYAVLILAVALYQSRSLAIVLIGPVLICLMIVFTLFDNPKVNRTHLLVAIVIPIIAGGVFFASHHYYKKFQRREISRKYQEEMKKKDEQLVVVGGSAIYGRHK